MPFLWFLPFCVLLLLLVELSYAPPPGLQQSFAQCPVLPQFLHVLMSVELVLVVLVVRLPFWFGCLPLPFPQVDLRPVIICATSISG